MAGSVPAPLVATIIDECSAAPVGHKSVFAQACDQSTAPNSPAGPWSRCTSSSSIRGTSPAGGQDGERSAKTFAEVRWAARLHELPHDLADEAAASRQPPPATQEEPPAFVPRAPFAQKLDALPRVDGARRAPEARPAYAKAIARAEPQRPVPFAQRRYALRALGAADFDDAVMWAAPEPGHEEVGDWQGMTHALQAIAGEDDAAMGEEPPEEVSCTRVPFAQKLEMLRFLGAPRRPPAQRPAAEAEAEAPKASFAQRRQEIRGLWDVEPERARVKVELPCAVQARPPPTTRVAQTCLVGQLFVEEEMRWC